VKAVERMAYELEIAIFMTILILLVIVALTLSSIRIINPWEQGLEIRLGTYIGKLNPGLRIVTPVVTHVVHVDLRTTTHEVPAQEVVMRNRVPVRVDALIYIKVIDPEKSYFEINNYKVATVALAQTVIRTVFADLSPVEVARDRESINMRLRGSLDEATDKWGVMVEGIELRLFESGGKDLWKELAHPAPLAQLKLHAGTPLEEAATCQILTAQALMEKLKWDNRDIAPLRELTEKAEKALASGDHAGALRLALRATESALEDH
jgi:hypothetical protein